MRATESLSLITGADIGFDWAEPGSSGAIGAVEDAWGDPHARPTIRTPAIAKDLAAGEAVDDPIIRHSC